MRAAGRLVAETHRRVREAAKPGVTTLEIDELVHSTVCDGGGKPLFLGYRVKNKTFPASACISVNHEVVHGIPSKKRRLRDGDIVSVDIGVKLGGYCGDSAWTYAVGEPSPEAANLLRVGEDSLMRGIEACLEGGRVSDIGRAIQAHAEGAGYFVVKDYVGHGIGKDLHEEPQVPNYVAKKPVSFRDPELKKGLVLAIEPMVNIGTEKVTELVDGWTVVTNDRSLSVHFEHTVAITENGPDILTLV